MKIFGVLLLTLYLVYFFGVALFLNTPLFQKVADMESPEQTLVSIKGALSPYPGLLWISNAEIMIRDQNVSIKITAHHSWIHFDLRPFLNKTVHTTLLSIHDAKVNLGFKTPEEKKEYLKKFTRPQDVNLELKKKLGLKSKQNHIKLEFPNIRIQQITAVETSGGTLQGDLSLNGGFNIQPGAEVVVFPTLLTVKNAWVPEKFHAIEGTLNVHFDPFFIPDAPGNAVFPFVNADIHLEGHADSLRFLDLTLRSMANYSLFEGKAKISTHLLIQKGDLLPGSFLKTEKSKLSLNNDSIQATGTGDVKWNVEKEDRSHLHLHLSKVSAQKNQAQPASQGTLKGLDIQLTLYGTHMVDLFHGFFASLNLKKLNLNVYENHGKITGGAQGNGSITAFSGTLPTAVLIGWKKKKSELNIYLTGVRLIMSGFPPLSANGTASATSSTVDLSSDGILFPTVQAALKITVPMKGDSQADAVVSNLEFHPGGVNHWKGEAKLTLGDTSPFVEVLKDQKKITWPMSALAKVQNLELNAEWESGERFSWVRFNQIHSSGVWTAYGSLLDQGDGMTGTFEAKVAGVPIGVRFAPKKSEITFLPSPEWYSKPLEPPKPL